jgi:hypothetical protein
MKNLLTAILAFISLSVFSQNLTLTSPSGLNEPYEVSSGTEVTVEWDYFETEPTYMFTYDQDPGSNLDNTWQFSTNPEWTPLTGGVDNGDGTWSYSLNITEDTWIFGAYNVFSGNSFCNVINVNVASSVVIDFEDGLICPTAGNETISLSGSYSTIEWYKDGELIIGESGYSYNATEVGSYYAIADGVQSNVLLIENLSVEFTGMLNVDGSEITLSASLGFDSYQWYSGPDSGNMTAISGATNAEYTAIISNDLVYYHVVATLSACEVVSIDRPVSVEIFTPYVLNVNADTNSFGNICVGSTIVLSIAEDAINYTWYKNGNLAYQVFTYVNITSIYQAGNYYVISNPVEWPEISLQSNSIDANYFDLINPGLFGVGNNTYHCEGEEIAISLTDEGYDYTWYNHVNYAFNDTDIVEVINNSYAFTFEQATYVTVSGSYQGCTESTSIYLNDYNNQQIYISLINYNQQYLCTDSIAHLGLPAYNAVNFDNYQWYEKIGEEWIEISGADSNYFGVSTPGFYKLSAHPVNCPSAIVESNEYQVKDYLERNLNLYADQTEICLGDTVNLNMYSNSWINIQWLEGDIQMGSNGYEFIYVPIFGAGTSNSQEVYDFNHYVVKARHNSCPNGLKDTSNPIIVKPSVNPEVLVNLDIESYRIALWDSAIFYLDCIGNDITLSIEDVYDSYQWYDLTYAGLDDYEIGNLIPGATSDSLTAEVQAQWITAEVSLNGCIGYTDPILLDGWVFLSPAVQSYDNDMICEGDSALVNLGFPGTWIEYYWTLDGEIIENSNNDSLWVTEPGQYVIFAYPEDCPDALYTSGIGPTLQIFDALLLEDVDEFGNAFFYAWPWQGVFEYQWYIDGVPYENTSDIPAVLWQDGLPGGVITVEITNTDGCSDISEGFLWDPSVGIIENAMGSIIVYPNPSEGQFKIDGIEPGIIQSAVLYNTQGKMVFEINVAEYQQNIDISNLPDGMYLLLLQDVDGNKKSITLNKL